MQRITLARLVLSLVLVGALALAGCGGSDGVSQSLHDQTVAEKDAAEKKAAEEEAARLAAEKKAAEEEAKMAAINAAQMTLSGAEDALMALGEDATDEARRDAHRMVEAAANTLRDVLRMNGGSTADIDAAIGKAVTAKNAAGALQAMITARADAATAAQMEAINTAQMTLSDAEAALMALPDNATDEAKRDAQRAVGMAAAALVQALTDNDGTADQIAAATMKQESAKMMADGLQATITAAADTAEAAQMLAAQRKAIADAIMATQMAVNAVNNDSTDDEIAAAGVEITKVTAAIAAATDVPDSEKAANTATVNALMAQLDGAKASRMAAMDAAAVAQRMAAINTAKDYLAEKEMALAALPDNATDEQMRDAQRLVEAAANNLRDVLQMNDGSAADIEAAVRKAQTAKVTADALQATITAAADAAKQLRMTAINTAQMELSDAEDALVMLDDDATDKEQRNAQRGVERAAADLLQVLMDNDGTAEQIQAATMKRDSAKMMADDLTPQVDIDDQRMAITNAAAAAATAVAAVDNDATDTEVKAADDAIADLEQAIADATDLPDTETAPWKRVLTAHETSLATNKKSRQMAMDDAAEEQRNKQRIADNAAGLLVADAIVRDTNGHDATTVSDLPAKLGAITLAHKDGTTTIALRRSTGVKLTAMNTMSPGDDLTAKRFAFDKNMGAVFTNFGAPEVMVETYSYTNFFEDDGKGAVDRTQTAPHEDTGLITLVSTPLKSEYFSFSGFPSAPVTGTTSSTSALPTNFKRKGSYRGVAGEFACATGCSVARTIGTIADTDTVTDTVTVLDMTFTPTLATGQTPDDLEVVDTTTTLDADYYHFGYWMVTSGAGANLKQTIDTFAGQSYDDAIGGSDVNNLDGNATYSGAAAGIYVHKAGAGDSLVVSDGEFVADAALAAQFGSADGTVAEADQWAVTGTISGFRPAMGDDDLSAWTLMLEKVDLGSRNAANVTDPNVVTVPNLESVSGATSGGGNKGVWSASFHGNAGSDTTTGDTAGADDYPMAAIGEFNGHFANGHVAGAFGAEKD